MANKEWSPAELKYKAETYCATAERCEQEVRLKLKQWNCDTKNADEIVDFLYTDGFLNDERYCRAFVHDKLLYQGWGRIKMEYMLKAKHLPSPAIRAALDTIDEIEYFRILSHLIEQRRKIKKDESSDALYRFLLQRGFTLDEIRQASTQIS